MKILIITKSLSEKDGQGRYSQGLIKELASRHQLTILTSAKDEIFEKKFNNLEVIKIPDLLSLGWNFKVLINYFKIFKKSLKNNDFIHFFTDLPNYLIFSPLMFSQIKPYFITAHGTFSIAYFSKGWRKGLLKKFFSRAQNVFCISNFTKKEILKRVDLKNLVVINNGIDFEKFNNYYEELKDKVIKPNNKVILSVGAIKPRKGYQDSLKAVSQLKDKYPDLKYYIVGSQENKRYLAELKKIIKQELLENNVEFFENLTDEELAKLYLQADLLLFTPVNFQNIYFEGFGLVCLEAGVFKKPVIGSLDCGVEDAVKDNQTGYLVPQGQVAKIAEAIDKILSNQTMALSMGEANRQFAEELQWLKIVKNYENYYINLEK